MEKFILNKETKKLKNIDYAKISTLLEKERVRTREYLTEQIESIK